MIGRAALLASIALLPRPGVAATVDVPAEAEALRLAVERAAPGDVLRLAPGRHLGPLVIDKPLTIEGQPGVVIDGRKQGRVVDVKAPDVAVRGVQVVGSGDELPAIHAGVFLDREAKRAIVEKNEFIGNLIGVVIQGAEDARVEGNHVVGRENFHVTERGNGIQVWNAPGAQIIGNRIEKGRDGIFSISSKYNRFIGNRMENVRFAIHYMYTNNSEISGNQSIGNDIGYALMFSNNLQVTDNSSIGSREHGIALNYTNNSKITGNHVEGTKVKCVFLYNANNNLFTRNHFEGCGIGIHFTAGSEGNKVGENSFIGNETQVKYVGTRIIEWSTNGRGNYWSDNPAFDLDGNGLADAAYRPNDVIDRIVWSVPLAKLLLNSPAVQVVRYAQAQFPALETGGVVDSAPLMQPVTR